MIYSCGCQNEIDADSGVMHCVKKCDFHVEFLKNQDHNSITYYEMLGCLKDGVPQNKKYLDEIYSAAQDLNCLNMFFRGEHRDVLEIGCGLGQYVPMFLAGGWNYEAVELSEFAARWTHSTFDVDVDCMPLQDYWYADYNLIFAVHVIEHMLDMPQQVKAIYEHLYDGGNFFILVPDDSDKTNPDHFWFFTEETLRGILEKTGFKNIRMVSKQIIEREKFIYCIAEK